mmetsp:Transcript_8611/g.7633  ORF Transcript_8611/g.7633 Transcript_8611/m.7633 type:complete len:184 (+) Transcript_8611:293-844(+)
MRDKIKEAMLLGNMDKEIESLMNSVDKSEVCRNKKKKKRPRRRKKNKNIPVEINNLESSQNPSPSVQYQKQISENNLSFKPISSESSFTLNNPQTVRLNISEKFPSEVSFELKQKKIGMDEMYQSSKKVFKSPTILIKQFTQSDNFSQESDKAEAKSEEENEKEKQKRKSLLFLDNENIDTEF